MEPFFDNCRLNVGREASNTPSNEGGSSNISTDVCELIELVLACRNRSNEVGPRDNFGGRTGG